MSLSAAPAPAPIRLLVVDDEPVIAFALEAYFRANGFEIDAAGEREEAIALLAVRDYDAVIADLMLSGSNSEEGLDVIRFARDRNCFAGIVLLTAYNSANLTQRALDAGANVVLNKPKPLVEVADTVASLLERGRP
jgi:two-component system OmpR family response regulator